MEDRSQDTMASCNGQFLLFDAFPFLCPLPLDLLRRRRVGMMDTTGGSAQTLTTWPRLPPSMTMASAIFLHGFWLADSFVVRLSTDNPNRAVGYPVLPAIYIVMALFIDIVLLRYKLQFTWPESIVVLLGGRRVWARRAHLSPIGETKHGELVREERPPYTHEGSS